MRYGIFRVVNVIKPNNKDIISVMPTKEVMLVSAVAYDGYQQVFPLFTTLEIAIGDVILVDNYQRFPNLIDTQIVKIIKGKEKEKFLRLGNFFGEDSDKSIGIT